MYTINVLPKENRLTTKKDFERVLNGGKMVQSTSFGFAFLNARLPDGQVDNAPSRIGFIISNKISTLAVARNRIRRILRQIVRENLSTLPKGFLFVILARRNILERPHAQIKKEVERVLERVVSSRA